MKAEPNYWTSNLDIGSKVFIKEPNGNIKEVIVTNYSADSFSVTGITAPFNKVSAMTITGFTALPNESEVREQYNSQNRRAFLLTVDLKNLSDLQIAYMYAGLSLAKRLEGEINDDNTSTKSVGQAKAINA